MARNLFSISRHPSGCRLHVGHARIHHGLAGLVAVLVGVAAMWRDRSDFPWIQD